MSRKLSGLSRKPKKGLAKGAREARPFVDEACFQTFGIIPKACDSRKQEKEKQSPENNNNNNTETKR